MIAKLTSAFLLTLVVTLVLVATPNYSITAAGIPVLTSLYVGTPTNPGAANNGTTTTITVTGSNLTGVTGLSFYQGAVLDPTITITNIIPNSITPDTKFRVDVLVAAGATVGPRNVTVTTPSGTSSPLNNGFTVYHASVSLSVPAGVLPGGNFWVQVNVNDIANLNASQFDLIYDPAVIQVTGDENTLGITDGVTDGRIPSSLANNNYPLVGWTFQPFPGIPSNTIRVLGHMTSVTTVTGSGYINRINFVALGTGGTSTNITLSGLLLFDANAISVIPDSITQGSVSVGLSITTSALPPGTTGKAYSTSLSAVSGTPPYTWGATGLPTGLNLNPASGSVSGTPSVSGNFNVNFSVSDSSLPVTSANKTLSLTIYPALQINTASLPESTQNKSYPAITLNATGGKPLYTWGALTLPAGLSLDASSGILSGNITTSGNFSINLTVTDSLSPPNTANVTLPLIIYPALQILTSSLPAGAVGVPYSVNVLSSGGKAPMVWSLESGNLPSGLSFNSSSGVIGGTPTTLEGPVNFSIKVTDALGNNDSKALSILISSGANLKVSVTLQGSLRPESGWVVPLVVKIFAPGADVMTAVPAYSFNLTTAKSGSQAIAQASGISPNSYDITVTSPTCLTSVKRGVAVAAPLTEVNMGSLLEGDANDSGLINIQDFGILASAYGKTSGTPGFDSRADFDRSGLINISDFGLLAANYAKFSPILAP